jgi:hypothetical protein
MRQLYTTLFLLACCITVHGQDKLYFTNGEVKQVSITRTTNWTVYYKLSNTSYNRVQRTKFIRLDSISYADGRTLTWQQMLPNLDRRHRSMLMAMHSRTWHVPMNEVFQLKVAPSSLLDPWGMMLPVYAEYDFLHHFGVEAMAAIPFNIPGPVQLSNDPKITGVKNDSKFSFNLIYYFHTSPAARFYVALEGFMRKQTLALGNGRLLYDDSYRTFTSATLTKDYHGLAGKIGYATRMSGHLWFDTYIGVGDVNGTSYHTHVTGLGPVVYTGRVYDLTGAYLPNKTEGGGNAIYLAFALRLSYHFNR